jgi:hypothetical protein
MKVLDVVRVLSDRAEAGERGPFVVEMSVSDYEELREEIHGGPLPEGTPPAEPGPGGSIFGVPVLIT